VPAVIVNDRHILFSETMLLKDYDSKGSDRKSLVVSLIGLDAKMK
jgi:hypothetical protein